MTILKIDENKCARDWFCVNECPAKIIVKTDREAPPELIENADELCIDCGHCIAVCPHAALSLNEQAPEDLEDIRIDLIPGFDQVDHFLRARRSIRTYVDKPVDKSIIQDIINTASYAPSGHNLQPVKWLVFHGASQVKELAGITSDWMRSMIRAGSEVAKAMHFDRVVADWEKGDDRIMRGAPHLALAYGDKGLSPSQNACVIALTYLELGAFAKGLGACWAGYFTAAANFHEPMKEYLNLGEDNVTFGAMMLGRPKYKYRRIPERNKPVIDWR